MLVALMIMASNPAYGEIKDRWTGTVCPKPLYGADLYDYSLYPGDWMLNTSPAVALRCLKMRQELMDKYRSRQRLGRKARK